MIFWLYNGLLLVALVAAITRGQREERILAVTMLFGSYSTVILYRMTGENWLGLNLPLLLNEAAVTAICLYVAYSSKRFWSLPFAAMQMMAMITPLAKLFSDNLESYALGVAQALWAYPQLLMIIYFSLRPKKKNIPVQALNSSS